MAESIKVPQAMATLSSFFGGLALLLAMIGLYETVSYSVARRRTEIGVRLTLGARPVQVKRAILREDDGAVGPAAGHAAHAGVRETPLRFSVRVDANDPLSLTGVAALLMAASLVAGLIPAQRAARLDPVAALRED